MKARERRDPAARWDDAARVGGPEIRLGLEGGQGGERVGRVQPGEQRVVAVGAGDQPGVARARRREHRRHEDAQHYPDERERQQESLGLGQVPLPHLPQQQGE